MANRRAGKFREPDKRAAREANSLALNRLRPAIDIVRDNNPIDDLARRVVVFDAAPGEVEARARDMPADVIIEPEILHYTDRTRPRDFIGVDRRTLLAPATGGARAAFRVEVRGDGSPLEGTLAILFLRGLFGLSRELEATTGVSGGVSFSFGSFWTPSALVVLPVGGFWSG